MSASGVSPVGRALGSSRATWLKLRRLAPWLLHQKRLLALILGLTAAVSAATAVQPWPLKLLVDHALGDAELPSVLRSACEALGASCTPSTFIVLAGLASLAEAHRLARQRQPPPSPPRRRGRRRRRQ